MVFSAKFFISSLISRFTGWAGFLLLLFSGGLPSFSISAMFLCLVSVEMKWLLPPPALAVVAVAVAVEVVLMVATLAEVAALAGLAGPGREGEAGAEERGLV